MSSKLLHDYESAPQGSPGFSTRLIELVTGPSTRSLLGSTHKIQAGIKTTPLVDGVLLRNPNAIYIHADRREVIYLICRLLDSQTQELTKFLLSDTTPLQYCPLPILPNEANRQRVEPERAIQETGIYRDPWDRRLRPLAAGDRRLRDVIDLFIIFQRRTTGRQNSAPTGRGNGGKSVNRNLKHSGRA
ncbi:hypothetical protein P885DRAFT_73979 [Corynascus similis CBS 632.67]